MNDIETIIMSYANDVGLFTTHQLVHHLITSNRNIPNASLYYHLNNLINRQLLIRNSRGVYSTITFKPEFNASLTKAMNKTFSLLHNSLPFADFCLYIGTDLTQFQHNMAANNIIYVETHKDTCSAAFNILCNAGKTAYLQPNRETITRYVNFAEPAIFVKSLISESPLKREENGISLPTIEKLLVDIHVDEDFFYLQGEESFHIFRNAIESYRINEARLLRYARRRNIEPVFNQYLKEQ